MARRPKTGFDSYLAKQPYDAMAHLVRGYNLRFSGQPAEATKAFERLLEIDPDHLNTTDNDVAQPAATIRCLGTTTYGDLSNQGTPGLPNTQCP